MTTGVNNVVQDLQMFLQEEQSGNPSGASNYYQKAQQDITSMLNNPNVPEDVKQKLTQALNELKEGGGENIASAFTALQTLGGSTPLTPGTKPLTPPINPLPTPINPPIEELPTNLTPPPINPLPTPVNPPIEELPTNLTPPPINPLPTPVNPPIEELPTNLNPPEEEQ